MRFLKITELPEKMRYSSTSHIFDPYDLFFDSIYTHKKESGRYLWQCGRMKANRFT